MVASYLARYMTPKPSSASVSPLALGEPPKRGMPGQAAACNAGLRGSPSASLAPGVGEVLFC